MPDELKNFDYLTHYKTDAEEFDYFEQRTGATLHEERRVREAIIKEVPNSAEVILDVGCGSGWVAKEFLTKNKKVISLDISKTNPFNAKNLYKSDYHFPVVADSFQLPFSSDSIDCIIASEIIEHVINPEAFIKELIRVVKIGGKVVVSTPYKEKIRYVLCIHCNKKTPVNAHLHSFDEKILETISKKNGIKKITYTIFGNKALIFFRTHIILKYFPFPVWFAIDWLANKIYEKPLHVICVLEKL
jgi:ubiquinone/menaquinone biosynthesis C-methylase UbiE